jgi:hypothetical protein
MLYLAWPLLEIVKNPASSDIRMLQAEKISEILLGKLFQQKARENFSRLLFNKPENCSCFYCFQVNSYSLR